jgi:glycerol-3-phosphate dehydrogenase (NAD(P)+)
MSRTEKSTIAVLGAGGWGTTLAILLCRNGHDVRLWEFFQDRAEKLLRERKNETFLPGIDIPEQILITNDQEEALRDAGMAVFALPSHLIRDLARQAAPLMPAVRIAVNVAKGLEKKTWKRMSQVLTEELPGGVRVVTLSGPSHAEEVSREIPTAVVVASEEEAVNCRVQEIFLCSHFRVYTNTDIIGVELAGSLKNIIAIATGICDGLGYGDNTKGALITRGLAEISRLGLSLGAQEQTFAGLSGMGDLITTCTSRHSRNRYVGEQIGRGQKLGQVLSSMEMVAEGVNTAESGRALGRDRKVEMPITEQVYQVLFEEKDPQQAVNDLMTRDAKAEVWW